MLMQSPHRLGLPGAEVHSEPLQCVSRRLDITENCSSGATIHVYLAQDTALTGQLYMGTGWLV